jgi:signal transduction histidine kinase
VGTLSAWLGGILPGPLVATFWFTWWAGDALGNLLVTPLVLVWATRHQASPLPSAPAGEVGLSLAIAVLLIAGSGLEHVTYHATFAFAALPLLIWLARRYGQRAVISGLAATIAVVVVVTSAAYSRMGMPPQRWNLLSLQAVMGVCAVATMVLAATVTAHRRQELALAQADAAMRENVRMLNEAEAVAHSGSWEWDVQRDHFAWSAGMYRTHHHGPDTMPATYAALLAEVYLDDQALFDSQVRACLATGKPFEFRYRLVTAEGETRTLLARGKAVRCPDGAITTLFGTCQDVTRTQKLETTLIARSYELQKANDRDEAIFAALAEGLLLVAPDGRITRANRRAETILHETAGRLTGQRCRDRFGQDCLTGNRLDVPVHLDLPDGTQAMLRMNVMSLGTQGTVLSFRDVTHEEEVNRLKSEFISLASHELRTPLTIMLGSLQLLQQADRFGLNAATQREYVDRVVAQGLRLSRLVDDLLQVGQIERGTLPLRLEPLDLAGLLADLAGDWAPVASGHGIALAFPPPDQTLPAVMADPGHVRQILTNLIDNAIKYSPAGGTVAVSVSPVAGFLRIVVADHGIGIAAAELPCIFERFHRIVTPLMFRERGTGLGLFITRQLVELQGGQITVSSQPGQGTSFAFTLPLAESAMDRPAIGQAA